MTGILALTLIALLVIISSMVVIFIVEDEYRNTKKTVDFLIVLFVIVVGIPSAIALGLKWTTSLFMWLGLEK